MLKNAAIYIADPSIIGSRLFDSINAIKSYKINEDNEPTSVLLEIEWGQIRLNFMENEQLEKHLKGFSAYIENVISDQGKYVYVQNRICYVTMCIGCIIQHRESTVQKVESFLFELNGKLNGLLFLYDSIFDYSGEFLGGLYGKPKEIIVPEFS